MILAFMSLLPIMFVGPAWVPPSWGSLSRCRWSLSTWPSFEDSILRFSFWSYLFNTWFDWLFWFSILSMLSISTWPLTMLMLFRDFSNCLFWASCSIWIAWMSMSFSMFIISIFLCKFFSFSYCSSASVLWTLCLELCCLLSCLSLAVVDEITLFCWSWAPSS